MNSFAYKREITVFKKDENGNKIPLTEKKMVRTSESMEEEVEQEVVVPGKFETEKKWVEDYVNLETYIRAITLEDGRMVLMLNDGHEESRDVPVLKNKRKPATIDNITQERQRQYVCSEVVLALPEDIDRLRSRLNQ